MWTRITSTSPTARFVLAVLLVLTGVLCFAQSSPIETPVDVVLLLDESGSMYGQDVPVASDPGLIRWTAAEIAALKLYPDDRIAVVPFTNILLPGTAMVSSWPNPAAMLEPLENAYRGADYRARHGQNATSFTLPMQRALDLLGPGQPGRAGIVILMTDGKPDSQKGLDEMAAEIGSRPNTKLYAVGLGSDVNQDLMQDLAAAGKGYYVPIDDPKELPSAFSHLLKVAAGREVGSVIRANGDGSFKVGKGARELRILMPVSPHPSPIHVTSPDGAIHEVQVEPTASDRQSATAAWYRDVAPMAGTWTIVGAPVDAEVSFEAEFKATIMTPIDSSVVGGGRSNPVKVLVSGPPDQYSVHVSASGEGASAELELPVNAGPGVFQGNIDIPRGHQGDWTITATPYRGLNADEEGAPHTIRVSVVDGPPGVPIVQLIWPHKTDYRVSEGSSVDIPIRWEASDSENPRALRITSSKGVRISPASIPVKSGSDSAVLTMHGPFESNEGDFDIDISAALDGPGILTGKTFHVHVRSLSFWDRLGIYFEIGLVLIVAFIGLCLSAWWVGKLRARQLRKYREALVQNLAIDVGEDPLSTYNLKGRGPLPERVASDLAFLITGPEVQGDSTVAQNYAYHMQEFEPGQEIARVRLPVRDKSHYFEVVGGVANLYQDASKFMDKSSGNSDERVEIAPGQKVKIGAETHDWSKRVTMFFDSGDAKEAFSRYARCKAWANPLITILVVLALVVGVAGALFIDRAIVQSNASIQQGVR